MNGNATHEISSSLLARVLEHHLEGLEWVQEVMYVPHRNSLVIILPTLPANAMCIPCEDISSTTRFLRHGIYPNTKEQHLVLRSLRTCAERGLYLQNMLHTCIPLKDWYIQHADMGRDWQVRLVIREDTVAESEDMFKLWSELRAAKIPELITPMRIYDSTH